MPGTWLSLTWNTLKTMFRIRQFFNLTIYSGINWKWKSYFFRNLIIAKQSVKAYKHQITKELKLNDLTIFSLPAHSQTTLVHKRHLFSLRNPTANSTNTVAKHLCLGFSHDFYPYFLITTEGTNKEDLYILETCPVPHLAWMIFNKSLQNLLEDCDSYFANETFAWDFIALTRTNANVYHQVLSLVICTSYSELSKTKMKILGMLALPLSWVRNERVNGIFPGPFSLNHSFSNLELDDQVLRSSLSELKSRRGSLPGD